MDFNFPFKPYPTQIELMNFIYENLDRKSKVSFAESPTGTGKTLSILCSVGKYLDDLYDNKTSSLFNTAAITANETDDFSSWLENEENCYHETKRWKKAEDVASKHQKLRQHIDLCATAGRELEQFDSENLSGLKRVYICSRTHSQLKQIVNEFHSTVYSKRYSISIAGSRVQYCINKNANKSKNNLIIKDKCKKLVSSKSCEYYDSDRIHAEKYKILTGNVDIESLVTENDFSSQKTCPYYMLMYSNKMADIVLITYNHLFKNYKNLELDFDNQIIVIDEAHNTEDALLSMFSVSLKKPFLREILNAVNAYCVACEKKFCFLTKSNVKILKNLISTLLNFKQSNELFSVPQFISKLDLKIDSLTRMNDFLVNRNFFEKLKGYGVSEGQNVYTISDLIDSVVSNYDNGMIKSSDDKIEFFVTNFGEILEDIVTKSHSTIFTAGTLKPLDGTLSSFRNSKLISLGHVIPPQNVQTLILSNCVITEKTKCANLYNKLGETLNDLAKEIPHGLVCFFQSYKTLESAVKTWNTETGLFEKINSTKKIFTEGLDSLVDYKIQSKLGKGAILLAVCGGSLSEGIDFKDEYARGVIIFGMPFSDFSDPIRNLLFEKQLSKSLSKYELFENKCMKTVNQTIGRAFRHENDYAVAILVDSRFAKANVKAKLPNWMLNGIIEVKDVQTASRMVENFFENR